MTGGAEALLEDDEEHGSGRWVPVPPASETRYVLVRISRDQRRSRRHRDVRAKTISVKRLSKRELEIGRVLYPDTGHEKPTTRAECINGIRPCPYVSCQHHLYLDVAPRTGAIKLNFPDIEPGEMKESCVLDVADRGGTTLDDVGAIMNVTRERIRQVEVKALAKIELDRRIAELAVGGPDGRRRLPVLPAIVDRSSILDELDFDTVAS